MANRAPKYDIQIVRKVLDLSTLTCDTLVMQFTTAIAKSARSNEIVRLPHDSTIAAALANACDDSVNANGVTEYWGTVKVDGDFPRIAEWRVHLT